MDAFGFQKYVRSLLEINLPEFSTQDDLDACYFGSEIYTYWLLVDRKKPEIRSNADINNYLSKEKLAYIARYFVKKAIANTKDPADYVRTGRIINVVETAFNIRFGKVWIGLYQKPEVICECGAKAIFTDSCIVYGHSRGNIYYCPSCGRFVGVHQYTDLPLGVPADKETREARIVFHEVFSETQKRIKVSRGMLYDMLARQMKIPYAECHGGKFNAAQCYHAVDIMKRMV